MNKTSLLGYAKKVEYTPLKLYENKRRTWRNHQRHDHKVQGAYF